MAANGSLTEDERVGTAGERELLEGFLEYHRHVLSGKLRGLSETDARRRLVPSLTTPIGVVKHAAAVERAWFQHQLAGRPREQIAGNARGDAASWEVGEDETIADVIAEYDASCAESRRVAAVFDLDHTVPHERLGRVSLRWIYVHMIREHARHAGHADILREQLDGVTGTDAPGPQRIALACCPDKRQRALDAENFVFYAQASNIVAPSVGGLTSVGVTAKVPAGT